ncbi:MAG: hypothetical protein L7T24_01780 [Luminiphilus sp.]|nr:hypothetical protein [Luminiphilus sp.]
MPTHLMHRRLIEEHPAEIISRLIESFIASEGVYCPSTLLFCGVVGKNPFTGDSWDFMG